MGKRKLTPGGRTDDVGPGAPHLVAGAHAETRACEYLCAQGLHLVTRNYRTRRGEIDLIMDDASILVFVEVRFRRPGAWVSAAESITRTKRQRIVAAASHYLATHRQATERRCRFDVVAVSDDIRWLKRAFDA